MDLKNTSSFPTSTAPAEKVASQSPLRSPKTSNFSLTAIKAKLEVLADAAKYDASCSSSGSKRARDPQGLGNVNGMGICHSYTPDGRCISLLKILLTNFCIYDCKFCINRVSSDTKRARFTPAEVAWLTMEFYRRNYIEGLFLSSGVVESGDTTMELLIEAARMLRQDYKFNGYIHLKIVPEASDELIQKAGRWADRVSANIEMPTQQDLNELAPAKKISTTHQAMDKIKNKVLQAVEEKKKFKYAPRFAPAGQSTQMIVGATPSPDSLILGASQTLYKTFKMRRVYYSAYSPIPHADASLPVQQPLLIRENRLYQADWLLRFYGFQADELTDEKDKNLSLDYDPKTAWALRNRHFFPINVNTASREELLRVPGIGVRNAERILQIRNFQKLRLEDLGKLRIPLKRAKFFVTTADHNPNSLLIDQSHLPDWLRIQPKEKQMTLFDDFISQRTGEL